MSDRHDDQNKNQNMMRTLMWIGVAGLGAALAFTVVARSDEPSPRRSDEPAYPAADRRGELTCSRRLTSRETARSARRRSRSAPKSNFDFTDLLANGQAVGRAAASWSFASGRSRRTRARRASRPSSRSTPIARARAAHCSVSANRTQPFCPVFGACGGCQVQHLSYPAQLAWKTDMVRSALQRIGGFRRRRRARSGRHDGLRATIATRCRWSSITRSRRRRSVSISSARTTSCRSMRVRSSRRS